MINLLAYFADSSALLDFFEMLRYNQADKPVWNSQKGSKNNLQQLLIGVEEFSNLSKDNCNNIIDSELITFTTQSDKTFSAIEKTVRLAKLDKTQLDIIKKRKQMGSKYDISELLGVDKDVWNNIKDRKLIEYESEWGTILPTKKIKALANLNKEEWNNVINRDLLSENFINYDIANFAKLENNNWDMVKKYNLYHYDKKYIDYISQIDKSRRESVIKLINEFEDNIININASKIQELSDTDIDKLIEEKNKTENRNVPFFVFYEKIRGFNPVSTAYAYYDDIESALISTKSEDEFNKINNTLYGEKPPEIQKLFDDFNKKYPDVKLRVNNNITFDKAKKIIQTTEDFINYQEKGNLPFVKTIQFCDMKEKDGVYKRKEDTIYINTRSRNLLEHLIHENGHFRDFKNGGLLNKTVPDDVQDILRKILSNYSTINSAESIAELIKAIETPDDKDDCHMTKKIRLRKDNEGNSILMIAKDSNINKEEVEKLGEYFRNINCPEIIPDYDESVHGTVDSYYEVIISKK